jgi:hypothetical protein
VSGMGDNCGTPQVKVEVTAFLGFVWICAQVRSGRDKYSEIGRKCIRKALETSSIIPQHLQMNGDPRAGQRDIQLSTTLLLEALNTDIPPQKIVEPIV